MYVHMYVVVVVRAPLLLYAFVPTYSTTFEILVLLNALSSDALEEILYPNIKMS